MEKKLPNTFIAKAQQEAQKLLRGVDGIQTIVFATIDGFDVASASKQDIDPKRIAATASSIAAISAVISEETQLGKEKSITIDTHNGFALIYNASFQSQPVIIEVIADNSAVLAQVNYKVAQIAKLFAM